MQEDIKELKRKREEEEREAEEVEEEAKRKREEAQVKATWEPGRNIISYSCRLAGSSSMIGVGGQEYY